MSHQNKKIVSLFMLIFLTFSSFLFSQNKMSSQSKNRNPRKTREWRVNIGGQRLIDSQGREWLADHIYRSSGYGYLGISGTFITQEPIKGTREQAIFQSERYKLFGYRIDVPNGHYKVILHFAEVYHAKAGKRLMNIKIEGQTVLKNLDIVARIGHHKALSLTFNTQELNLPVLDGRLDVGLINKRDATKLSGIEVIQLGSQPALLKLDPPELDFGLNANRREIRIINQGSEPIKWTLNTSGLPRWLNVSPRSTGSVLPEGSQTVSISVSRAGVAGGIHRDSLLITAPGFRKKLPVSIAVGGAAKLSLKNSTLDFGAGLRHLTGMLENNGGSALNWSIPGSQQLGWVQRIYPSSGRLQMGESTFIHFAISRQGLKPGTHQQTVTINSEGGREKILIKAQVLPSQNRHIFVSASAQGGGDGRSWETAFTGIKEAIARVGKLRTGQTVEIWVAAGVYYEYEIVVPTGVALYGGFQGNETVLEERNQFRNRPTIVDGQKRGRCFECEHRTVIDGFVIQHGRDWSSGEGKGAAILMYDSDVKVRNNLIRDNVDSWAGALFIEGFEREKNKKGFSPLVEHNILIGNVSNYCAAAIEVRATTAIIRNNTIVKNRGFGLEIQDLLGPFKKVTYGKFYNNIITANKRNQPNDVWAEARKVTDYSFVGTRWHLVGAYPPYDYGKGNLFGDISATRVGFVDDRKNDFHLTTQSPAINAGDPTSQPDTDGSRADLGALPYNHHHTEFEFSTLHLDFDPKTKHLELLVTAYGGKKITWQAVVDSPGKNLFSVSPATGVLANGEQAKLNISLNRKKQAEGKYTGHLAVMTPERSYEIDLQWLVNRSQPEIQVTPQFIEVEGEINGAAPAGKQVRIGNSGTGTFHWAALKNSANSWLQISQTSGKAGEALFLRFNTAGLGYGNFYDEIKIIGSGTINRAVKLPVTLKMRPGKFIVEIEAEKNSGLPNPGWHVIQNKGAGCIRAKKSAPKAPNDSSRIDYEFQVPDGLEYVYVFAEVDVNRSKASDSFWIMVNGFDPCSWNYIRSKHAGWRRHWVYNHPRDKKHMFVAIPGKNTLNVFSRETGACINWLVITSDPNLNIDTYRFGSGGKSKARR